MEKIYGMHKLVGLQLFGSGTPTFSSGTPTFCQMGVLNSCFQNPSESSVISGISHALSGYFSSNYERNSSYNFILICLIQIMLITLLPSPNSFVRIKLHAY